MLSEEEAFQELICASGVEVQRTLASTQKTLLARLSRGEATLDTIVAVRQTAGHGRQQRDWYSPVGGLWFSTRLDVEGLTGLSLLAGLACVRVLDRYQVRSLLRWPNDVLVEGRKIAGVLVDVRMPVNSGSGYAVVGIGLNVEVDFPAELQTVATSLHLHAPGRPVLGSLLAELLSELRACFGRGGLAQRDEVGARSLPAGTPVRVWVGGEEIDSQIAGMSPDGALLLANGQRHFSVDRIEHRT